MHNLLHTDDPKGVMISYENLLHNFEVMEESYHINSSTIQMCLLPHSNGYGLVGSYLHTLYAGASAYFMSTHSFLKNPSIWMQAMSEYKATHAKVPSSALYESCDLFYPEKVNLESVQCIACLEPVLTGDVNNFEDFMRRYGLKKNIISIGYGLAEHVALVCGAINEDGRVVATNVNRISCGKPVSSVSVKIVCPMDSSELDEGEVGEIWVNSKSNAVGYYKNPEKTLEIFLGKLDESDEELYLCTGDLGFMQNGELFICEKKTDVLTIEDKDLYPTDIESEVEYIVPALRREKLIAAKISPTHPENEISILAELKSPSNSMTDYEKLKSQISNCISEKFEIPVFCVVLFEPGAVPCNTFGKRQRSLGYKLHLTGDAQAYKWIKPKVEKPAPVKQKKLPIQEGRLSVGARRLSAPATPFIRPPKKHMQLKRAKSDFMGQSSLSMLMQIISKALGRDITPDEEIWGDESSMVDMVSKTLKEEYGVAVDVGTLLLAQSSEDLVGVMQMSLMSAEQVNKQQQPVRLTFGASPPSIYGPVMMKICMSETSISLRQVMEFNHKSTDIAIIGMGGIFGGQ